MQLKNNNDPASIVNNSSQLASLENDCMKDALRAVGLDALTLANGLKDLVTIKQRPAIKAKGLDLAFKVRGDYVQATVDNRPININIPWGMEREKLDAAAIEEAVSKMTPGEQATILRILQKGADNPN